MSLQTVLPIRRRIALFASRSDGFVVGVILFATAAAVLTALAMPLDVRVLDGERVWLKPLKFQISLAVLLATLVIALAALPRHLATSRWLLWPARVIAAVSIYEILFLSLQAGRGKASHFNDTTPFDAIGATIMAVFAGVLVGAPALMGVVVLLRLNRRLTP